LWQPNQTANFPALAITSMSGFSANPDAKAFAPHQPKTQKRLAVNLKHSGALLRASGGRRPRTAAPC